MRSSLFAYGFRAQFLLAGCAALLLVPVWASNFALGTPLGSSWPPTLWHAHEMLFGFIGSAIAGFLLTAVPSWTGERGYAGRPLMLLAGIWLAARLLIASSAVWPAALVAAVDLSFLPLLAVLVGRPLLRTRSRNRFLLLVLALLWLCDLVFHVALLRANSPLALHALQVGIDLVLLMVTVVGGRIVPAFTTAALRPLGASAAVRDRGVLTVLAVSSMVLVTLTDVFAAPAALGGWIAAVAALLQAARLLQWATWRTLRLPIVWVLHLGYAWLPVGLGLKALALLSGAALGAFWLHALTMGALTTMIVAVMSRAALGHTGRALVVHPLTTLAYLLLTGAALIRVFGLAAFHLNYVAVIVLAGLCWSTAFALFVGVYAPILWLPRADGKPG
jgi:uncharacterized protein involved in response to NO